MASLPFCGPQKIPQQLILHPQPLIFIFIFRQCLCRLTPSRLWYPLCVLLSLSTQQMMYWSASCQAQDFLDLFLCLSLCQHLFDFWQQFQRMLIFPCHKIHPPRVVFILHRGRFVYCPLLLGRFKKSPAAFHCPHVRATICPGWVKTNMLISIHTPRTGSDRAPQHRYLFLTKFQSTLPVRGATSVVVK